jgi:hypothetical protein
MENTFSSLTPEQFIQQVSVLRDGLPADIAGRRMKMQNSPLKVQSTFRKKTELLIRQFTSPLMWSRQIF